ncbi:rhodanese-like domain-containing protein [Pseudoalteromonas sp. SSM20]|jgi:rhodanese-related sulfurtransferase|uniref:rhodanese-like domain-containing protein n=1 Tax=Pseudoalteromonas sp. SSM20 TaxID=3139394 RepID=UPI003BACB08F
MLKTIPDLIKLASENVKKVDSAQAKAEIAQNNGLLIDVREPAEHAIKNAVGAINIPRGVLEMKLVEIEKDADRPIYLHCATGGRATLAAEQLQRVGYNKVTVISCKAESVCETFC